MENKVKTYWTGIGIPVAVGLLSAYLTRSNMDLYQSIVQPKLSPPAVVFPIVWTILYILMGISSTMVYNSVAAESEKSQALLVYGLQLIFNFFWSIFFFNYRAFLLSFVWLMALWILIAAMIVQFYKINATAARLQIPYFVWVTFAGYLNLMIYILNR